LCAAHNDYQPSEPDYMLGVYNPKSSLCCLWVQLI